MMWQELMDQILAHYREILGENLLGAYVHGSIAFGCFHPEKSDIDFLIVTERAPDMFQKERMIRLLLELAPFAPQKGFEMSLVLREHCRNFVHPAPYQLHYSAAWHDAYERDMKGTLQMLQGVDSDLSAHFTVTRAAGIALVGPEPEQMFAPVPWADYWDSIRGDVESAVEDVAENPVYVVLNLCRVLAAKREGAVLSKAQGGRWGLENLPEHLHEPVKKALLAYETGTECRCSTEMLREFAAAMLKEIES